MPAAGISRWKSVRQPSARLAPQRFGTHGEHDDDADDDLLQEGGDVEKIEAVAQHADDQHADQRSADAAAPPDSEVPPMTTAAIVSSS